VISWLAVTGYPGGWPADLPGVFRAWWPRPFRRGPRRGGGSRRRSEPTERKAAADRHAVTGWAGSRAVCPSWPPSPPAAPARPESSRCL